MVPLRRRFCDPGAATLHRLQTYLFQRSLQIDLKGSLIYWALTVVLLVLVLFSLKTELTPDTVPRRREGEKAHAAAN